MSRLIKIFFFAVIVRPVVLFVLGLNRRGLENLPQTGPAILAANHNSHLDTLVLMSLYPLSKIHKVRPVAAADYFFKNRLLKWFALTCIGIIPLDRSQKKRTAPTSNPTESLFAGCHQALQQGNILIIYPEGSRGKPEEIGRLRKGLFHLLKDYPETPVIPVLMHGLGYALPKGEALLVPYNCDVIVGLPLHRGDNAITFNKALSSQFTEMSSYCLVKEANPESADE